MAQRRGGHGRADAGDDGSLLQQALSGDGGSPCPESGSEVQECIGRGLAGPGKNAGAVESGSEQALLGCIAGRRRASGQPPYTWRLPAGSRIR